MADYELYYWPSIQGRGELIRLALEDAGARYRDVARLPASEGGGVPAMMKLMHASRPAPFAPPFLRHGKLVVAQSANVLAYLAPRLGLVGKSERARLHAHQHQLTLADLVAEAHDTHHPIASSLYYEDQKLEAARRAKHFVAERLPKFLGYFERELERGGNYLLGRFSYVDLSLFQLLEGAVYGFPKAFRRVTRKTPRLLRLRDRVAARPRLAAYLASPRRVPMSDTDLFRRYPELDR